VNESAGATVDAGSRRPSEPLAPVLRAQMRLPRELQMQRLWYRLRQPLFKSRLYRLFLPGRVAGAPGPAISSDIWPGNAERGSQIIQGILALGGQTIRDPAPVWNPVGAADPWLEAFHSFDWLRDLRAVSGESARRAAREFVGRWIADNSHWSPLAWRPDILGRRLTAWILHYEFLGAAGDAMFRGRLLLSIAQQASHLCRILPAGLSGSALLHAIAGLTHAGLVMPRGGAWLRRGVVLLSNELARQVLGDGGHCERSPSVHFEMLRLLVGLRAAFGTADHTVPEPIAETIGRMARMLRFFEHGDGGLALFNDSNEEEDWLIDMVLARADGKGLPPKEAPVSGFQRLGSGRTLILVDAGAPPPPGFDRRAHAGTLSFEMSVGSDRLIVNCGAHEGRGDWWVAQRATAAHSTLVVNDTNACVFATDTGLVRGPVDVTCRRDESAGNTWLEMSHDGYAAPYGLIHHRRIYLTAGGEDLRGEDRVDGGTPQPFVLRFHLHPDVNVSVAQNAQAAILKLPTGGWWRIRAKGGSISLADSIYMGKRGEARRSQQIVVTADPDTPDHTIRWAITKEAVGK
jgi:uncharacterized heparinase superfamily protein